MCIEKFLLIFQGLLTPVIAGIAAYIAWQQWKTNQQKLNLDRYERRLKIYQEVRQILGRVLGARKATSNELVAFITAVSEADFLFDADVPAYIDEIYRRGLNLWSWSEQYRDDTQDIPEGYDHAKVVAEMHKELEWFASQPKPAKDLFNKYLSIGG